MRTAPLSPNPREAPDEAGTAYPSLDDDIKVVELEVCAGRNNFVSETSDNYDGSFEIPH